MEAESQTTPAPPARANKNRWVKTAGVVTFLFFLIKGLVWLGIAALAWWKLKG